jgi:hypothetical protein
MKTLCGRLQRSIALLLLVLMSGTLLPSLVFASSHMDAPLITLDPTANTTAVYAFVNQDNGRKSLVVALGVYPFEEPGIGPNKYNFDDNVGYEIHLATGPDVAAGRATISYQFRFKTSFKNKNTTCSRIWASFRRRRRKPESSSDLHGYKGRRARRPKNRVGLGHCPTEQSG